MSPTAAAERVALRAVEAGDDGFIRQVFASTRAAEIARINWTDDQKHAFLNMQFTAQDHYYRSQYPDADHQVVLVDGQPAGRYYVHRNQDRVLIVDVALLPNHRGHGVGTALLESTLSEAQASGMPVVLNVEMSNPAARLYRRLGFTKTAEQGIHEEMTWHPEPATAARL
ncbi:MAG TPA: GNAT family N-acetyltransferase [Candidatus Dormibacteraeota bacterium]|nr:GNAT family N-acetyltransferase [Candidatus Dormibacteraeota bacterium]